MAGECQASCVTLCWDNFVQHRRQGASRRDRSLLTVTHHRASNAMPGTEEMLVMDTLVSLSKKREQKQDPKSKSPKILRGL